jgi:hypothetical protein
MEIRPVGTELFVADRRRDGRTDGRTDGRSDITMLIVAFRHFVNAPDKGQVRKPLVYIAYNHSTREIAFDPVTVRLTT